MVWLYELEEERRKKRRRRGEVGEEERWQEDEVGGRLSVRKPLDAEPSPCGELEKERTK